MENPYSRLFFIQEKRRSSLRSRLFISIGSKLPKLIIYFFYLLKDITYLPLISCYFPFF